MKKVKILKLVLGLSVLILLMNGQNAFAACSNPAGTEGQTLYNADHKVAQFCNGTDWIAMSGGGDHLGNHTATTAIDLANNKVTNLAAPTAAADAATKAYVDAQIAIGGADNLGTGGTTTGQININNSAPTVLLQDTDHRSGKIHMNNNILYFLNGTGTNSTAHGTIGSYWPLEINMGTDILSVGGQVSLLEGNLNVRSQKITFGDAQVQQLYGDNGGYLRFNSNHDTATGMRFFDKQGTHFGYVYGDGNGANFGLLDGDGNWSYLAKKDTSTELRINNGTELYLDNDEVNIKNNALKSDAGTIRDPNGGWVRTYGGTGWYSQTYGGGWHMSDSTWIRSYNNKPVYVNKHIRADDGFQVDGTTIIDGNGNLTSGDRIADNTIDSSEIQNETLTASDLAANSVGASEIAANAVGTSEIATNGVGAAEIAANAVGASEIAANAVGQSEIANNAVTNAKIVSMSDTKLTGMPTCTGADKALQWNGSSFTCATISGGSGGGGGNASCGNQAVSWNGCTASSGTGIHESTKAVSDTFCCTVNNHCSSSGCSGKKGNAVFKCNNGIWQYQSGSCNSCNVSNPNQGCR